MSINHRSVWRALTASLLVLGSATAVTAETIPLDFGNTVQNLFGSTAANLTMQYATVATDSNGTNINATITADSVFTSNKPDKNGSRTGPSSTNGDARINMARSDSEKFTLSLWDAGAGSGYDNAYAPAGNFEWDVVFYDIDGTASLFDKVTLFSPTVATVTTSSKLIIDSSVPGEISFSGIVNTGGGNVPGEDGITNDQLTQLQADYSVSAHVENSSSLMFRYSVGADDQNNNKQRNLLVDGGTLSLDDFPTTEVPEIDAASGVGSLAALAAILAFVSGRRRRAVA